MQLLSSTRVEIILFYVLWPFVKCTSANKNELEFFLVLFIVVLTHSWRYFSYLHITEQQQVITVYVMALIIKIFSETMGYVMKRKRRKSDSVLWQKPLYQQKIRKPMDNTKTPPKTSITQRLQTDTGRSVWVTAAIQLVWLNRFTWTL